ncbi:hypothetical protein VAEKB19_6870002 [Vibrio aestuarianus]|nr:hypothetical protein VAEKB19_6870002 [Vibrio aestuarianus]
MKKIRLGKFGGSPFANKQTASDFINKYKVDGEIVPHDWGFAVEVSEDSTFSQIEDRRLDVAREGSYLSRISGRFSSRYNSDTSPESPPREFIDPIPALLKYGLLRAIKECYEQRAELDSRTEAWIRVLYHSTKGKTDEAVYENAYGRLHSVTKRLGIDLGS